MKDYLLSVFLPLPAGHTFVGVYRIRVENTLAWVKAHADEIATRAAADALAALSAACSRIQSEQPARRFFSPEAMAEVDRLNLVFSLAAR